MASPTKVVAPRAVQRIKVSLAGITVNADAASTAYPTCGQCSVYIAGGAYGVSDVVCDRVSACAFRGCLFPTGLTLTLADGTSASAMLVVLVWLSADDGGDIRGAKAHVRVVVTGEGGAVCFSSTHIPVVGRPLPAIFEGTGQITCWDDSLQIVVNSDYTAGSCGVGVVGFGGTATVTLTCEAADGTNACGSASEKCFQPFTATYNCDSGTWTGGPTAGDKVCLPVGTATGWQKVSATSNTCTYRKYVPCGDAPCTVNADCASAPDAADPGLPFGGSAPPDCCPCSAGCSSATACSGCTSGGALTPDVIYLSFFGLTGNPRCQYETGAGGSVYRVKTDLTDGATVMFTQDPDDPCFYVADVSRHVEVWRCVGDGSGCGACDPFAGASVTTSASCRYNIDDGTMSFTLMVTAAGLGSTGGTPVPFTVNIRTFPEADPACCAGFVIDVPPPTVVSGSITDPDWNFIVGDAGGTGAVVFQPCAPGT